MLNIICQSLFHESQISKITIFGNYDYLIVLFMIIFLQKLENSKISLISSQDNILILIILLLLNSNLNDCLTCSYFQTTNVYPWFCLKLLLPKEILFSNLTFDIFTEEQFCQFFFVPNLSFVLLFFNFRNYLFFVFVRSFVRS